MKLVLLKRRQMFVAALLALFGLGLLFITIQASDAQQIPSGTLEQLQQQFQQRTGQRGLGTDSLDQQPITLQPAVPALERTLPQSRLEQIQSARAHVNLKQFGYDQLGVGHPVTIPQAGAVQDDYILGPGDEIAVSLRGQENNELRTLVDRNGQIVLPRLPPIPAMGRPLGSVRDAVEQAVSRAYVGTSVSISVARVRQITVQVSGEVNNAGPRLVTGLSSVVDALVLSGGVKKTGSLRNIQIRRGGRVIPVDLYGILAGMGNAASSRLADGDQIVVPPLRQTVAVTGLVRRPGIYELRNGQSAISIADLLALAGGQEVRGRYRLSVLHLLSDGQSQLVQVDDTKGTVRDSEILVVQLRADQIVGQATLSGGTSLAGSYPVVSGTKLSDILKEPGALGDTPYTPFGIIVRRDPKTFTRQLVAFTPAAVLGGREDMTLQSEDVVRVLSTNEIRLLNFVARAYLSQLTQDQNRIRNPLAITPGFDRTVLDELNNQSGQGVELQDLSSVSAAIQRHDITALLDTPAPGSELADERAQMDRLQDPRNRGTAQGDAQGLSRGPGAQLPGAMPNSTAGYDPQAAAFGGGALSAAAPGYNGSQPGYNGPQFGSRSADPYASTRAMPRSPHERSGEDQTQNFMEQSVSRGEYASNREVQTFGQLARQLSIDPLVLINFLIDHRAQLDGAIRGPGSYFVGPNATLSDLVQAAGGTINWANESGVELISTVTDNARDRAVTGRKVLPLHEGMLASYVVQPYDKFRFSQIRTDVGLGAVTVQGEVRYPGSFSILRGEHLSDLLARAGGLTSTAYPDGTVYLRKSAAQAEREGYARAADEVQSQLVIAMTRVGSGKIDPNTFSSMQTFVTELRNRQALGRISIVADPRGLKANPARDPLLESGDVIYIPPRPSTVAVLGQVLQPGNFTYRKGATVEDYIDQAGGYAQTADESLTYIVLPNGEARRVNKSWLNFEIAYLPPGSSIVVPRDITPLDLRQTIIDVSQIFSQFAVSIASVAVLSRQ
jgi:protein involved in polysaccharide export with SLBB domain